jgi:hypothetical protein
VDDSPDGDDDDVDDLPGEGFDEAGPVPLEDPHHHHDHLMVWENFPAAHRSPLYCSFTVSREENKKCRLFLFKFCSVYSEAHA